MKHSKIILVFLVTAFMTSCLVSSLHPFYKPQDKFYDTAMEGYWMDADSAIWTIFPHTVSKFMGESVSDTSYLITYYEEEDKYSILDGTLFRLNGVDYVDFLPDPDEDHCTSDMTAYHHIPVHTLARVQYCKDSILLYWFGDEWLNELFEKNRVRIQHETVSSPGYDRHVLTADTEELQKFIRKYANDPKTMEDIEKIFAKGNADGEDEYGIFLKLKPFKGELPPNVKKDQPG
jgi:hypothetical protein